VNRSKLARLTAEVVAEERRQAEDFAVDEQVIAAEICACVIHEHLWRDGDPYRSIRKNYTPEPAPTRQRLVQQAVRRFAHLQQRTQETGDAWAKRVERVLAEAAASLNRCCSMSGKDSHRRMAEVLALVRPLVLRPSTPIS
jgi:hypothetical protein